MSIKKNFSSRLSLYVLLMAAGVMVALAFLIALSAVRRITEDAREKAALTLDNTILKIDKVITEVERSVDNLDWVVQ